MCARCEMCVSYVRKACVRSEMCLRCVKCVCEVRNVCAMCEMSVLGAKCVCKDGMCVQNSNVISGLEGMQRGGSTPLPHSLFSICIIRTNVKTSN